jgi:hypothetical protein
LSARCLWRGRRWSCRADGDDHLDSRDQDVHGSTDEYAFPSDAHCDRHNHGDADRISDGYSEPERDDHSDPGAAGDPCRCGMDSRPQGRIVILRCQFSPVSSSAISSAARTPEESDFAQMESWGLNVIRLPIAWNYMEPQPNQFDDSYLHEQVDPVVAFAGNHGIAVIPELHQFLWSPCFSGGNGAPAWVCEGRGYTNDFAGAVRAGCEFIAGLDAPDGRMLKEHFADVWRLVAHHFADDERVVAFNFINEPHSYACPLDAPTATHLLYELYRALRTTVRDQGAMQMLVLDPPVVRNLMIGIPTEPLGPDIAYARICTRRRTDCRSSNTTATPAPSPPTTSSPRPRRSASADRCSSASTAATPTPTAASWTLRSSSCATRWPSRIGGWSAAPCGRTFPPTTPSASSTPAAPRRVIWSTFWLAPTRAASPACRPRCASTSTARSSSSPGASMEPRPAAA